MYFYLMFDTWTALHVLWPPAGKEHLTVGEERSWHLAFIAVGPAAGAWPPLTSIRRYWDPAAAGDGMG